MKTFHKILDALVFVCQCFWFWLILCFLLSF